MEVSWGASGPEPGDNQALKPCLLRRNHSREQYGVAASCLEDLKSKGRHGPGPSRGLGGAGAERGRGRVGRSAGARRGGERRLGILEAQGALGQKWLTWAQ